VSDWWEELVRDWWPDDPNRPTEGKRRGLEAKRDLVARLRPRSISEIGVRAGYSAFAMLSVAPDTSYFGIDNDSDTHGGVRGAIEHAERLLARFPNVRLHVADSRDVSDLGEYSDLLHIDGDHSVDGCTSDLDLGLRSGVRWMIVDDTDHIPDVRRAIDAWLIGHPYPVEWIDDGHHGTALITLHGP
jgi:hypothetical protein